MKDSVNPGFYTGQYSASGMFVCQVMLNLESCCSQFYLCCSDRPVSSFFIKPLIALEILNLNEPMLSLVLWSVHMELWVRVLFRGPVHTEH